MKPLELSELFVQAITPLLEKTGAPFPELCGLEGASLAWTATLLGAQLNRPVVIVTATGGQAEALYREALFFQAQAAASPHLLSFPAWEVLPFEPMAPFGPLVGERISTLSRLAQMGADGPVRSVDQSGHGQAVTVTTPAALMQRLPPRAHLLRHAFSIAVGDQLDLPTFRSYLTEAGYRHAAQAAEPGEFSVRGGILDFFPPGGEEGVRVELFGDEVETMRLYDPISQRSTDPVPRVAALPVREVILNADTIAAFRTNYRAAFGGAAAEDEIYKAISQGEPHPGMEHFLPLFHDQLETFFDYLPSETLFLLAPGFEGAVAERDREIQEQHDLAEAADRRCLPIDALYPPNAELHTALGAFTTLTVRADAGPDVFSFGFEATPEFHENADKKKKPVIERLGAFLNELWEQQARVGLSVRTVGQKERLRELLEDRKIPVRDVTGWNGVLSGQPGVVHLALGDLGRGFVHRRFRITLISEESIFGQRVRRRQMDRRYLDQLIAGFADLAMGDLVVHTDHGIGHYGGLVSLEVGEVKNDFLLIRFADDDKLYVPVENLDRVGKHTGGEEAALDRLGAGKWEKTKERARKKIMEMAGELVQLQAMREAARGVAFSGPDPLYQEFSAAFPFEETPDQAQAIQSVLEDMASPRPMDRLVCGDVGFGKTEVALRATFRAAMDGKQTAVLVPTTILAQQHFDTFSRRLAPYPVKVALLSRFRTPAQQKKAVEGLAHGRVDVVIGTHRLLQNDIAFRDLGLLIVDEEQRFGVTHKEKIKKMRATVDILTLTATPIPRTLNMAMAGVRDISIIASPPPNRLAIRTIVTQFDRQKIREAILREIYRGGQVFYLFNRVQEIERTAAMIGELVPEAKVGVAHGQMRESHLERVMISFYRQEFNVLVCSTIIENGVDIPSANTIIIHRADRFGLGQLHQLRGRVGRSKHRAYAYLLTPPQQVLSVDAQKRLEAIETLGELGAGFMLATHDLEIRGAGNILGDEQSGEIREVGYELYNQMLREAIAALKAGGAAPENGADEGEIAPMISMHLSTFIPEEYVSDVQQRLSLYKRIAQLEEAEEIEQMRLELADRFGPIPESVDNLLKILAIKWRCRALKITKLEAGPKGGVIQFHPEPNINPIAIMEMLREGAGLYRFNQQERTLSLRNRPWDDPKIRLRELGEALVRLSP